jgi:hypothetical protein
MAPYPDCMKPRIRIGNKSFIDVTNETTSGEVFSEAEAKVYGEEGRRVACNY